MLVPAEAGAENGRLLVDVVNCGRPRAIHAFNRPDVVDAPAIAAAAETAGGPAGDGFLMERGYSMLSIGWQWDVPVDPNLFGLEAPRALIDGREIRGQTAIENRVHVPYSAADLEQPDARLLVRDWEDVPDTELPRAAWRFGREVDGGTIEESRAHIFLEGGFVPGRVYQLVYEAEGAPVVGCGLSRAARDSLILAPVE